MKERSEVNEIRQEWIEFYKQTAGLRVIPKRLTESELEKGRLATLLMQEMLQPELEAIAEQYWQWFESKLQQYADKQLDEFAHYLEEWFETERQWWLEDFKQEREGK